MPYYALCLFAEIRPGVPNGEIKKLKPEAVNLETGIIHISAEGSKAREPRRITIQPNLAAWLRAYSLDQFPIVVGNFPRAVGDDCSEYLFLRQCNGSVEFAAIGRKVLATLLLPEP